MLRAELEKMSDIGLEAKSFMEKGEMVPDSVLIAMVEERIKEEDCLEKGWLLDGFPRTAEQAAALEKMENGKADIVIMLDVEDSQLVDRVVGRRSDPETGKIYHLVTNPPESEEIANRLEQRADDNEETVKVRLENYHANKEAVLSVYQGTYVPPPELGYTTDEGYTTGYDSTMDVGGSDVELGTTVVELGNLEIGGEEKKDEEGVVMEAEVEAVPETETEEVGKAAEEEEDEEEEEDIAAPATEDFAVDGGEEGEAPTAPEGDNSRIFNIDGNRAPADISEDIYQTLVNVTFWEGIPGEEEEELAGAAMKIQGIFRTREAKKRVELIKEDNGIDAFTELKNIAQIDGLPDLVQFLIDKGADVNISDDDGNFPLHWALRGATVDFIYRGVSCVLKGPVKDEALLDMLSQNGADMDVCNKKGETLLHTALNSGDTSAALRLLDAGAHPNAMDADGLLPIHHACMSASPGFDEVVTVLLASGNGRGIMKATHSDPRKGKSGKEKKLLTLEGIIESFQSEALCPASITQRLVDKKEILQLITKDGYTALHYAAGAAGDSDGDLDTASRVSLLKRLLLDDAVDINVCDVHPPGAGATALHCSIKVSWEERREEATTPG